MTIPEFIDDSFPEPETPVAGLTPLPDAPDVFLPDGPGEFPSSAPSPTPTFIPEILPELQDTGYTRTVDGINAHEGPGAIPDIRSAIDLAGKLDCYLARVVKTYYGVGKKQPTIGVVQGIDAERIDARWDATNNDPVVGTKPSPRAGTAGLVSAIPFPLRGDQARYHVAPGDVVTILQTGDGEAVFLCDDLPFVGVVVAGESLAEKVTEQYAGGVEGGTGLYVRQQIMTGDPAAAAVTLADREANHDAWVTGTVYAIDDCAVESATTYRCKVAHTSSAGTIPPHANWEVDNIVIHRFVNVLVAANMAPGYRVGDKVLVIRRGSYLFCLGMRQTFLGTLSVGVNSGPSSAADFADEHYWVQEVDPLVTYGTDNWTFDSVNVRSQTDPTGSGGRMGRWVDAVNLAERTGATHLLPDELLVEVSMWRDADFYHYYTFDHAVPAATALGDEIYKVKVSGNDTTPEFLDEKVVGDGTWIEFTEVNDAGDEDWKGSHIGPNTSVAGYFIQITGLTGTVQDTVCTCKDAVCGIRVDIRGHTFAYEASGSSNWKNWPTGAPDYS